jgi:hypothetical protein
MLRGAAPKGVSVRILMSEFLALVFDVIDAERLSSTARNCTGFCTDCLHPGLTGAYWPFRGMLAEVIEAKGRRFYYQKLV